MMIDLAAYPPAARDRIARRARRSAVGEASAIWGAGGALTVILLAMFGKAAVLEFSVLTKLRPFVALVVLGFALSGAFAWVHLLGARKSIGRARKLDGDIRDAIEAERRAEVAAKLDHQQRAKTSGQAGTE